LQWLDWLWLVVVDRALPVGFQLAAMLLDPFSHEPERSIGEGSGKHRPGRDPILADSPL